MVCCVVYSHVPCCGCKFDCQACISAPPGISFYTFHQASNKAIKMVWSSATCGPAREFVVLRVLSLWFTSCLGCGTREKVKTTQIGLKQQSNSIQVHHTVGRIWKWFGSTLNWVNLCVPKMLGKTNFNPQKLGSEIFQAQTNLETQDFLLYELLVLDNWVLKYLWFKIFLFQYIFGLNIFWVQKVLSQNG